MNLTEPLSFFVKRVGKQTIITAKISKITNEKLIFCFINKSEKLVIENV